MSSNAHTGVPQVLTASDDHLLVESAFDAIMSHPQGSTRTEEALEAQGLFTALFERILKQFTACTGSGIDSAIETSLRRVAGFIGSDHAYVLTSAADQATWSAAYEWCGPGVPARIALTQEVPLGTLPWSEERVLSGGVVRINTLGHYPSEASADRLFHEAEGARSVLNVPIQGAAGRVFGCVGLHSHAHELDWTDSDVARLQLIGDAIVNLLERKRTEEELQNSREQYALAVDGANDGLWNWDVLTGDIYFSPRWKAMLGYADDEVCNVFSAWEALLHPEDRERATATLSAYLAGRTAAYESEHRLRHKDGSYRWVLARGKALWNADGRPYRMAGSHTDITDRKRGELELAKAYEEIKSLKERLQAENVYLREELSSATGYGEIVGSSDSIRRALLQARQVAATESTVLLLGETGTGKELLAHYIHNTSRRSGRPFIIANLAAMPVTLIESELFGREKGAFTGALTRQVGRFEAADKGTIFLDEIGEMPADTQAKLLRVLESGEFERLGSSKTIRADVRVIAATNRDLEAAVRNGTFRQDLYYRLNVFPITVPPLRERREDIAQLTWAFVQEFGERMGKPIELIKRSSLAALEMYPWPGNIRELRNVIERSMIMTQGRELRLILPDAGKQESDEGNGLGLQEFEKRHICRALDAARWRIRGKGGAADLLGLKASTLYSRMKKLGIHRNE